MISELESACHILYSCSSFSYHLKVNPWDNPPKRDSLKELKTRITMGIYKNKRTRIVIQKLKEFRFHSLFFTSGSNFFLDRLKIMEEKSRGTMTTKERRTDKALACEDSYRQRLFGQFYFQAYRY